MSRLTTMWALCLCLLLGAVPTSLGQSDSPAVTAMSLVPQQDPSSWQTSFSVSGTGFDSACNILILNTSATEPPNRGRALYIGTRSWADATYSNITFTLMGGLEPGTYYPWVVCGSLMSAPPPEGVSYTARYPRVVSINGNMSVTVPRGLSTALSLTVEDLPAVYFWYSWCRPFFSNSPVRPDIGNKLECSSVSFDSISTITCMLNTDGTETYPYPLYPWIMCQSYPGHAPVLANLTLHIAAVGPDGTLLPEPTPEPVTPTVIAMTPNVGSTIRVPVEIIGTGLDLTYCKVWLHTSATSPPDAATNERLCTILSASTTNLRCTVNSLDLGVTYYPWVGCGPTVLMSPPPPDGVSYTPGLPSIASINSITSGNVTIPSDTVSTLTVSAINLNLDNSNNCRPFFTVSPTRSDLGRVDCTSWSFTPPSAIKCFLTTIGAQYYPSPFYPWMVCDGNLLGAPAQDNLTVRVAPLGPNGEFQPLDASEYHKPTITAMTPKSGPVTKVPFNFSGTGLDAPSCVVMFHTSTTDPPSLATGHFCTLTATSSTMATCTMFVTMAVNVTYYPWVACGPQFTASPPPPPDVSYTAGLPQVIAINGNTSGTVTFLSNNTVTLTIQAINFDEEAYCWPMFTKSASLYGDGATVSCTDWPSLVTPDTFQCTIYHSPYKNYFELDVPYYPWLSCMNYPKVGLGVAVADVKLMASSGIVTPDTPDEGWCLHVEGFTAHPGGDSAGSDFTLLSFATTQEAAATCLDICECNSFLTWSHGVDERSGVILKQSDIVVTTALGSSCFYTRNVPCVPPPAVDSPPSSNGGCLPLEGFTAHPGVDNWYYNFTDIPNVTAQEAATACLGICDCRSFLTFSRNTGQRGRAWIKYTEDGVYSSSASGCFYTRDDQCGAPPAVDGPAPSDTNTTAPSNPPVITGIFRPNTYSSVSLNTVPTRSNMTIALGVANFSPECEVKFSLNSGSWPPNIPYSADNSAMVSCTDPAVDPLWSSDVKCTLDTSLLQPYAAYVPWVVCPGGVVSDATSGLFLRATGYTGNTALACDGDAVTLDCGPEEKVIAAITSVFYGRWDTTTCYGGPAEGCATTDYTSLRQRLEDSCIGQPSCSLQMMGWGLGDPCGGVPKALNVTFTCRAGNGPAPCTRPMNGQWCSHKGATVYNGDCDGDGASDWACKDDLGHRAVLASSKGCVEPFFWGEPAAIVECPALFDSSYRHQVSWVVPPEGPTQGAPITVYGNFFDATCTVTFSRSQTEAPSATSPGNCIQPSGTEWSRITCLPVEGALDVGTTYYPWVYCNGGWNIPPLNSYTTGTPAITDSMISPTINGPTYGDTLISFSIANFVPGCSVYFGLLDNESAVINCTNPVVDSYNRLSCTLDASQLVPYYGYFPRIVCPGGFMSPWSVSWLGGGYTGPYLRATGQRMNPAVACQTDPINLDCSREGKVITRITSVLYGRWDTNTCYGGPAECTTADVSGLERYLTDACVGQPSCSLMWPEPGDPCGGVHKGLRVGFQCGVNEPPLSVSPALRSEVQTGTMMTIRGGVDLSAGCAVSIGGQECTATAVYEGGRALRCLAPSLPSELQTLAVTVTCASFTATRQLASPSTTSAPILTSAWPASGPDLLAAAAAAASADTPLTINLTGANFGSPGACYISVSGVPCNSMRALSAAAVSCTISNVTSGLVGGRTPLVALLQTAVLLPGAAIPVQVDCGSQGTATFHLTRGNAGGCRPGQVVLPDGSCSPCPAGSYSTDGRSCTPCAAGTYVSYPGSLVCGPCSPGWFSEAGAASCSPCPPGTASNEWAVSRCAPCAPGTFSSYSSQGTRKCQSCAPGTFSTAEAWYCSACPAGTYTSSNKSAVCLPCRAGTSSPLGSSSCSPCPAGSSSVPGSPSCTPCAPGTVSGAAGASVCSACPAGTYSADPSATSCTPCGPGTFAPPGANTCSPCPYGTASNKASADACALCPVGQVSVWGATTCSPCPAGTTSYGGFTYGGYSTCVTCPAGSYSLAGSVKGCVPCPAGNFSTTPGAASCQACPAGTASGATGRSSADACTSCPPGTFAPAGSKTCKPCGLGAFSNTSGAAACTPCAPGYSTDGSRNATACTICPPGTIANQPGSRACTPCPAGYRSNPSGPGALTCAACQAGTTSTPGSATCSPCPAGTYSDAWASPSCTPCPQGSTTPVGASSAAQCSAT